MSARISDVTVAPRAEFASNPASPTESLRNTLTARDSTALPSLRPTMSQASTLSAVDVLETSCKTASSKATSSNTRAADAAHLSLVTPRGGSAINATPEALAAPVESKHVLERLLDSGVAPRDPDSYSVKIFFGGHAIAPDTSRILEIKRGPNSEPFSWCFCVLPTGTTSTPVMHPKLRESWWIVRGQGEMARKRGSEERVDALLPGHRIDLPKNTTFQFRSVGEEPLVLLIRTSPSWPGPEGAVPQPDYVAPWKPLS